ncbi:hypothetical protein [Leucothrix arctica]|uniref:VanZ-like domain-containing protein n=1 Tax=Leucothrix arctica TaxID=1481894 RepID=A0A317C557_9GAMM|nr:hypothetical protein [Leucothrix arctica]PWQ93409.1 hypothetical protein DKT75_17400 [Leucothrix arctica]
MKNSTLLLLITVPLLLTALFYLWFREGTVVYQALGLSSQQLHFFDNNFINSLPSFAHVYSLSLLSWWANGKKYGLFSIILWVIINIIFELGQLINHDQASYFPPLLADYFANGHFSVFDVIAILFGALAAYITINKFKGT